MAAGCVVLASDTEPVRDVIEHGANGLLRGFFDIDGLAEQAIGVLRDPARYRHLGRAAERTIRERYDIAQVVPAAASFLADVVAERR